MIETKLQWYEYVQRRPPEVSVRKVDQIVFSLIRRGRGRLKMTLGEIIIMDL